MRVENINRRTVKLEPLQLHHVYDLREWEQYEDPLFNDYNFPYVYDSDIEKWFNLRVSQPDTKSFAVVNEDYRTIGLINIKNIRKILKIANLGIVFDKSYINHGYGTMALEKLLNYFFEQMKMRTLFLDVAVHNKRAIRIYEKCGFMIVKKYLIKLQGVDEEDLPTKDRDEYFVIKNGIIYFYCFKMKLSKNEYEKLKTKGLLK